MWKNTRLTCPYRHGFSCGDESSSEMKKEVEQTPGSYSGEAIWTVSSAEQLKTPEGSCAQHVVTLVFGTALFPPVPSKHWVLSPRSKAVFSSTGNTNKETRTMPYVFHFVEIYGCSCVKHSVEMMCSVGQYVFGRVELLIKYLELLKLLILVKCSCIYTPSKSSNANFAQHKLLTLVEFIR